jgi:hypothetical protein
MAASVPDLARLARLLDIIASSQYEGEIENALGLVRRLLRELRAAGIACAGFIDAARERDLAMANAVELQSEVMALQAELDSLRSNGTAVAPWSDVAEPGADFRATARWALDLQHQGLIHLSLKEIDFLGNCAAWRAKRLTPVMQPWFRDLIAKVANRSGRRPPA